MLAAPPYFDRIEWDKWEVFWGDERCVPPDHPESNYRMAAQALLDYVPIPRSNVYPINAKLNSDEAARAYEAEIKKAFREAVPLFDLILLGVGTDGHTASLFPGTETVPVDDRLVAANRAPVLDSDRLTFTLPMINTAGSVAFFIV